MRCSRTESIRCCRSRVLNGSGGSEAPNKVIGLEDLTVGGTEYRLVAALRDDVWTAHAERQPSGARFGIDCAGPTEEAAKDRLARWLTWQDAHSRALEALQNAERAYHRAIAEGAFGGSADESAVDDLRRQSLAQIEAACAHLNDMRARRPE